LAVRSRPRPRVAAKPPGSGGKAPEEFLASLDELPVGNLIAIRQRADALISSKRDEAVRELRDRIAKEAAALGVEVSALVAQRRGGRAKAKGGTVRFRGPEGQEWSGRGRRPGWIREAEAQGKLADYRVE